MPSTTRFQSLFDPGKPPQNFVDLAVGVPVRALSDYAHQKNALAFSIFISRAGCCARAIQSIGSKPHSRFSLEIDQTASWRNMWVGEPHVYSIMTFASNCLARFLNHLDQDSVDFIDWVFE